MKTCGSSSRCLLVLLLAACASPSAALTRANPGRGAALGSYKQVPAARPQIGAAVAYVRVFYRRDGLCDFVRACGGVLASVSICDGVCAVAIEVCVCVLTKKSSHASDDDDIDDDSNVDDNDPRRRRRCRCDGEGDGDLCLAFQDWPGPSLAEAVLWDLLQMANEATDEDEWRNGAEGAGGERAAALTRSVGGGLGDGAVDARLPAAVGPRERKAGCKNFFWKTFTSC